MQTIPIFGTDGVRGRVGQAPMTPQAVMQLAHASGALLVERQADTSQKPAVVIGSDTRVSSDMLEAALQAGFAAAGVDSVMCGVLPTPAIAYLTRLRGFQAGVVVSASHNPYDDNGIKFFSSDGDKLSDAVEQAIEQRMQEPLPCVPSRQLGHSWRLPSAPGLYIDFCKRSLDSDVNLRGMRIVIDVAHGACHEVAPAVLEQLGVDVVVTGGSPNGVNINDEVGATRPEHLSRMVRLHHADLGIALDGDGDRLVMADASGRVFDGDELLYLLAQDAKQRREVCAGVAGTLMSNLGLEQALNRQGVAFARSAVGDRHVMQLLRERGWRLGGENSGHILCLDRHTTGDGVIAALQVLAAMRRSRKDLAQLCEGLQLHAQCLINVPIAKGADWESSDVIRRCRERTERALGMFGRVLLRASGTESVLRVMVECPEAGQAKELARALADEVHQAMNPCTERELLAA
ncbi:MAG: phosphoglucosamine mutase [Betaproteobacteria bacterium HGW-Betaproteobacteria-16]|nr:MAG: phosphoglucosamine mutase [Betaproteobacteria bacterium HGW-Betaproteobacteria-16]